MSTSVQQSKLFSFIFIFLFYFIFVLFVSFNCWTVSFLLNCYDEYFYDISLNHTSLLLEL